MSHRDWNIACKVYIGNLGNNASKSELESSFSKYGTLKNVWIARNPPGFAFVEYEDARDAEDAVRGLDGTRLCGNRIRVEMSNNRSRGRGGGGGGRSSGGRDYYGGRSRYDNGSSYGSRSSYRSRSRSPRRRPLSRSRSNSPRYSGKDRSLSRDRR